MSDEEIARKGVIKKKKALLSAAWNFIRHAGDAAMREKLYQLLKEDNARAIVAIAVENDDLTKAFLEAALGGHVLILEAFLLNGMNVECKDRYHWSALIYASANGNEECVRLLLDYDANVDCRGNAGTTSLLRASKRGYISIVELLLEKNANPDIQDDDGMTALMYASECTHKEVVSLLLNHGADNELKNKQERTALDLTMNRAIEELLQNHTNSNYVLK